MNLKLQLKVLSFLQFCLWGSWLTTLGSYMFVTLKFDGASIGAVYSSLGIAAVFMPTAVRDCGRQMVECEMGIRHLPRRWRCNIVHGCRSDHARRHVLCDLA
ncbi:nucleoside permease [Citrobacter koseri]|uniref:Nucleoside permease n=1 Tax=Citrobacter koseri TaxID=545 RepID=A0A2X2WDY3_CITKO|nr:nucleoside permease [Citrobacter koseri]